MKTREEALAYALSFPKTYQEAPFHDNNWQLVRVEGSKKVFLWTYEREGYINLNVKADPQWRDFWRSTYASVIPGWHQNKDHWNTIILDGTVPEQEIQRMIAESYDLVTDSPTRRIYEAVKKFRAEKWQHMDRLRRWPEIKRWHAPWEMHCIKIRIREDSLLSCGERKGRISWRICVWWRRCAGKAIAGGWNCSCRWTC